MNTQDILKQYDFLRPDKHSAFIQEAFAEAEEQTRHDLDINCDISFDENGSREEATPEEIKALADSLDVEIDLEDTGIFCPLWDVINRTFFKNYGEALDRYSYFTKEGVDSEMKNLARGEIVYLDINYTFPIGWCIEVMRFNNDTFVFTEDYSETDGSVMIGDEEDIANARYELWQKYWKLIGPNNENYNI